MRSKFTVLFTLAVFVLASFSVTASAWEKGHMKISPMFEFEEKWDSNVFYDSSDEKSDMISVFTPGIKSEFGFGANGKHKLRADYKVDLGAFAEYNDQNYANHDMFGELYLDFNDYNLRINDRFEITSDRAGTEFENRNLRKVNTLNSIVGMNFNKFSADIGYEHYFVEYHSDLLQSLDRYENAVWATGYVDIPNTEKTKGLLEFEYRNIEYKNTGGRNADAYSILAGIKNQITAKITGIAKAGFKVKDYRNSTANDFSSAIAHIDLLYDLNDRTDVLFSYHREAYESTDPNNNYYTGDHFLGNISYRFGGKFIARLDGMFYHNAYPNVTAGENKKRKDIEWA
ncbi:MAG: outer membrane beta-barrel protein, partial [Candidatus Omnitrophica bacterium]|nr:outer membrane beta-barrel protein [Candidatus Omnitrophota bacterium]